MQTSNKTTMSCKIVGIKHKLQMWCLVVFCLLFPGFLVSLYHRVDGAELCAHRLVVSPPIQSFIHSCFSNIFVYLSPNFPLCHLSPLSVSSNARRSLWEMEEITEDFYFSDPCMPFIFLSQLDLSHTSAFYCYLAAGSWPMAWLFSLHPSHYCCVLLWWI